MKFNILTLALLSVVPATVSGFVLPANEIVYDRGVIVNATNAKRADDEGWTLVLYDAAESGGQCGGVELATMSGDTPATNGQCMNTMETVSCVDVKISSGILNCNFYFNKKSTGTCDESNADAVVKVLDNAPSTTGNNVPFVQYVEVECQLNS